MPAPSATQLWDFAPVISLLDTLAVKDLVTGSESANPLSTLPTRGEVKESSSLGDFAALWAFLGISSEPAPSVPPLDYNEPTTDDSDAFDKYSAVHCTRPEPLLADPSDEAGERTPGPTRPADRVVKEDNNQPDESPVEDALARAHKRKEKKKLKKEQRRVDRTAKIQQPKVDRLRIAAGDESEAEASLVLKLPSSDAKYSGSSKPKTYGAQISPAHGALPYTNSRKLAVQSHPADGPLQASEVALAPAQQSQHVINNTQSIQRRSPLPYIVHPDSSMPQYTVQHTTPVPAHSPIPSAAQYSQHTLTPATVGPPKAKKPNSYLSPEDRHLALLLKLVHDFGEDKKWLVKPVQLANHTTAADGVHVFIDFSNIWIGFMNHMKRLEGLHPNARTKYRNISFDSLVLLLERGRPVSKRVLAGSSPLLPAFDLAKAIGYELNILDKVYKAKELTERQKLFQLSPYHGSKHGKRLSGGSGGENSSGSEMNAAMFAPEKWVEQGVDEILHLKILESVVDAAEPGTMVLATGDGAQAEYSDGFFKMVERALKKGWKVELVSWRKNISFLYHDAEFRGAWAERFRIVALDEYAEFLLDGEP